MFDAITIGSATRDAFFKARFRIINRSDFASGRGYLLPVGEKVEISDVFFTIGGNAVNAAVTFSRQGLKTACAAKIGSDVSGEEIKRRLKREGIDDFLKIDSKLPTAYSVILSEKGERTILAYHGAADNFFLKDLSLNKLLSRWWYISLTGRSTAMFKKLVQFAGAKKIALAFNPTGYHLRHHRKEILKNLNKTAFLVLNEEEAAFLTGFSFKKPKEVFKKLDRLTPGILAVTTGYKGAIVSDGRFIYETGVFPEKKLVDRTGAGDAFGSGFAAGLIKRKVFWSEAKKIKPVDIVYALRLAAANAASVVENLGATEGIIKVRDFQKPRWQNLKIKITRI